MNHELARLQAKLDRLDEDLRTAQRIIRRLETRNTWRPNALALTCLALVVALGVGSFGAKASSGDVPRSPATLSTDTTTKFKAPFEVDDSNGNPIMIVRDQGGDAAIDRGVYVYNESHKAVIDLRSTSDDGGGGMIKVNEAGPGTTSVGSEVNGVEIGGTQQKSGVQIIRGGKKVASIGAEQGDKLAEKGGTIQIFNASEKPIVSLSTGKNGGELSVYDAKNKQAATVASESGGGSLKIYGSTDKPKAVLGTESDGGSFKIFGTSENPVATLQSDAGDGKLWIGNKDGKTVAGVFANNNGGVVKVMKNGDPTTYTSMSAIDLGMGLAIRIADVRKSYVGTNGEGNGAVYVYGHGEDPVAGLTTYGSGKGLVSIFTNNTSIAFMAESDKHPGGGSITATDPAGNGIFSAGFTGEGGDACVNRKTGLKCLGVGLPLQINE